MFKYINRQYFTNASQFAMSTPYPVFAPSHLQNSTINKCNNHNNFANFHFANFGKAFTTVKF